MDPPASAKSGEPLPRFDTWRVVIRRSRFASHGVAVDLWHMLLYTVISGQVQTYRILLPGTGLARYDNLHNKTSDLFYMTIAGQKLTIPHGGSVRTSMDYRAL
jgi:hypothetical protein